MKYINSNDLLITHGDGIFMVISLLFNAIHI